MGKLGTGTLIKGIPTAATRHFFPAALQLHLCTTNTCRLANTHRFYSPALPYQLFVFQGEIFNGGNVTKSVFLVLLLQAAAAETFLPLSSPPSPPLPQGNSMGSPFLWPHTATKHSSPRGEGTCAITGSPHLRAQGKHRVPSCICIWIACFLNNVLRGTAFKLG